MDSAEHRARSSLPEGVFDTLPDIVKHTMINSEQKAIEHQQKLDENEQRMTEHQKRITEHEEKLRYYQEEEHKRLQEEEKQRLYREQKTRELARDREMLRRSGIVERIGAYVSQAPRKMNRVEEDHIDISSEFPVNEPQPISLIPNVLMGFRRETIDALLSQMEEIWRRANAHRDVQRSATGYIMFHLWSGGMRRAGTRAILVGDTVDESMPKLWEALDELIDDINRVKAGYTYLFESEQLSYIHLRFKANYYPEPKNISNWGDDLMPVEHRDHFDIFTASDININCVTQCGQRLFGLEFNSENIDDIIKATNKSVCIVKPHSSITKVRHIVEYRDLVIEANSPVKTLSVIDPNTIYLLHFDEHLGILENMKEPKRHMHYTQFRPLSKYPKCHKVTMIFDIECYFDTEKNTQHVPYLACACFIYSEKGKPDVPGNVLEFEGKDCVAQMIEYAADNVNEFGIHEIELVAHNGGGYDFHYLLTSMYDPSIIKNIMMRNNRFISFQFKYEKITFYVKDSLNFLLCSLNQAAKSFLDEADRKTDFPHHEIRSEQDLQRTFNEWINIDHNINVDVEKEKMLITSGHKINYSQNLQSKKLIDWAKEYCTNDVIVLAKVWIKFKDTVTDIFKCEIVNQTMTLAGMSFRLFEAHLPNYMEGMGRSQSVRLYHPIKKDFMNMREALIGGRCISMNGIYENVTCLDVKSLYPAAMAYYDQPYGQYRKVTAQIESELGIYHCYIKPVSVKGHGFFPLRQNGNVTYANIPESYLAWYTSVDIEIGRLEGHMITPIPFEDKFVGYSWKHKGLVFKEYIEDILYKLKLQYEQEKRPEHRQIIKIIMNALWGKFAQKWMNQTYNIRSEENCDMERDDCHAIFDTDYFLVKGTQKDKLLGTKPVQNGVFTLSWARYHMYQLWHKSTIKDAVCIYSDTDSMFVESKYLNKESTFVLNDHEVPVIGDNMGQLEVECVFDELICVGKKQYIGRYNETQYKKRFKGVPLQYVKPELYAHLIKDPDNIAQIKFLKFKREYGCVHGYHEIKTVRQTF